MPIINRELEYREQRDEYDYSIQGTVTGSTYMVPIPFLANAVGGFQASIGLSGTPVHSFALSRFVVGAGVTTIPLGVTITASAYGTSGGQFFTFGTSGGVGSTIGQGVTCLANDVILINTSGSNAAIAQYSVTLVIQCLQDYKNHFGI